MTVPTIFSASIGGYMGSSYKVELSGDVLTYTRMSHGYEEEEVVAIKPSDDDWMVFAKNLDELDIWRWKEHYPSPPGICDGTNWRIQLEIGGRKLESSGTNNYPTAAAESDENPFDIFTSALEDLLGGRAFR